jgi:hypothetical protein
MHFPLLQESYSHHLTPIAPKARPAGAERGDGAPASDGDGESGGAKPPGVKMEAARALVKHLGEDARVI